MNWYRIAQNEDIEDEPDFSHLPSLSAVNALLPQLAMAAQQEYNAWNQNEEGYDEMLGGGGICQEIANAMASILGRAGMEASTVSAQIGDQHVWAIVQVQEGVYNVDIHPSYYETGGGYTWKKIPNVEFSPEMISLECVSHDPNDFEQYLGD